MPSIKDYAITERLRSRSHTELSRAVRKRDNRPVILKVLHRGPWFSRQRRHFEQDFEIGSSLDLPCVLKPHALEEDHMGMRLVLDGFGGNPLDRLLARGRPPLSQVIGIALSAAMALGDIHSRGITHKSIQPANLFYDPQLDQLRLTGFGVATALKRETPGKESPQDPDGDLAYISPEQTGRMNRSLDHRSDFFSLGATIYECLTGKRPFAAKDEPELIHSLLARDPEPPVTIDNTIPAVVSKIVMKLLEKTPDKRYQSAFGLAADLRSCRKQLIRTGEIKDFEPGSRDRPERFRIPDKLYGREEQVDTLMRAFERTARGRAELMLVTGYSGIGKTALINELQKPIVRRQGCFISGKYDQYMRHIPYSALVVAFGELIRQILTQTEDRIERWRHALIDALAPNGQILIDVIPELELIIGPQPAVVELPSAEAQNRFDMVLISFVHVFAKEEHQLVLFLDDLQWIDSSSLRLLDLLITDPDSKNFLLLGAYRDNEVDKAHQLAITLGEIRSRGATVNEIRLSSLTIHDVSRLCADTLGSSVEQSRPLAKSVFEKTKGNPFFLRQFLEHLVAQGVLGFDFMAGVWKWNRDQIREMAITENVVDLMSKRLLHLPAPTREALKLAACIGNRFSLKMLAIVSGSAAEALSRVLWDALKIEVIVPQGLGARAPSSLPSASQAEAAYRFLHDRVQEAAYSLIPASKRQGVHLKMGRALLNDAGLGDRESILFDIVNHLNMGADLIDDEHERVRLARMNLKAGLKAKTSAAYGDARRYFLTGIEMLAPESWQDQYHLTLSLYVEAVEIAFLNTDFESAQRLSDVVVAKSRSIIDQVRVHVTRVEFLITRNMMIKALETAFPVLEMLGYPISGDPLDNRLSGRLPGMDEISDLPEMTDPKQLAAVQLLTIISGAAYQGQPELFAPIVFRLVNLHQENGLSPLASYAYSVYALLLCGPLEDIETGYHAGMLALKMQDRFKAREVECKVRFVVESFVRHWKEPHRDMLRYFVETVQVGLETGDFVYVAYTRFWSSGYLMLTGHPLGYVEEQQRQYADLMAKLKQENGLYPAKICRQLSLNLRGVSEDKKRLYGSSFTRRDMNVVERMGVVLTLFYVHFARLVQAYVYGDFAAALSHAKAAEAYERSVFSSMMEGGYAFYDALARLAAYFSMGDHERKAALDRVRSHLERLRKWRFHAPMNFRSKVALVAAELARVQGDVTDAIHLYEQACNLAREDGFPQEHAISAERAHEFLKKQGLERFAGIYLLDAYDAYCLWEAHGKVRELEKRHAPFPLQTVRNSEQGVKPADGKGERHESKLDITTLLKASQALSGEMDRSALMARLMRLAIENAGASRGVLILSLDGNLKVEALASDGSDELTAVPSVPLKDYDLIPAAVIRLVYRTGKTLVIGNAATDVTFSQDPYVLAHQPKSVMCAPIRRKDDIVAILYLENNLSPDVFDGDRLTVLNVLLAQVAISLDNADLFEKQIRAEANMRRLRNYLSNIIDSMPSVLVGVASDETISLWNSEAQKATGFSAKEAVGQPFTKVFPRLARAMEQVREALRLRKDRFNPRQAFKANDETRYEDVTVYPLVANDVEGAVIRVDDVTDRVRMEETMAQAQKMEAVGTLASGIAHDFNNLLQVIFGYTQISLMDTREGSQDYTYLTGIEKAAEKAGQLVQQLLVFSRKFESERKQVDLNKEILNAQKMLERTIPKMIDIDVHLEPHLWPVTADPIQMEQILLNLGTNAADAMPDGGKLTVETENFTQEFPQKHLDTPPGDYVLLTITDTGHGMDKETLEHIFEPFYTTKEIGKGTGLGLASVYGIVKNHGGTINCYSEVGLGTTFRIYIPAMEQTSPALERDKDLSKPIRGGNETILLVDDEEAIRDLASQVLEKFGYTVLSASSGEEALEIHSKESNKIHLTILDLGMPGMGGYRCHQEIIRLDPAAKVIISSGYSIKEQARKSMEAGAAGYVGKPYQLTDLLNVVRDVLEADH